MLTEKEKLFIVREWAENWLKANHRGPDVDPKILETLEAANWRAILSKTMFPTLENAPIGLNNLWTASRRMKTISKIADAIIDGVPGMSTIERLGIINAICWYSSKNLEAAKNEIDRAHLNNEVLE